MSQNSIAATGAAPTTVRGLEPDPIPVSKVRSSQVRDFLMNNLAKESKRQRSLDNERWEYLRKQNSKSRHEWLHQLEEQMNEAHSKLQMRSSSVLTHPSGRPHTGYEVTSVRVKPSALVSKIRVNGKFQLSSRVVVNEQGKGAKKLYDMYKTDQAQLYHSVPDTIPYARGRTPEINAGTLIPPVNKTDIESKMLKRKHRSDRKRKQVGGGWWVVVGGGMTDLVFLCVVCSWWTTKRWHRVCPTPCHAGRTWRTTAAAATAAAGVGVGGGVGVV